VHAQTFHIVCTNVKCLAVPQASRKFLASTDAVALSLIPMWNSYNCIALVMGNIFLVWASDSYTLHATCSLYRQVPSGMTELWLHQSCLTRERRVLQGHMDLQILHGITTWLEKSCLTRCYLVVLILWRVSYF